ncbi:MAG: N-acetylmuramoyl-L-alanine amidase family protein [Bacteroidota bacterium]
MNYKKFHAKLHQIIIFLVIPLIFFVHTKLYGQEDENYRIKTVVIDPGHGGRDSGARGVYSMEKDIVLDIARRLGKYFEENFPDIEVIFTRTTDTLIPLYERAEIANKNKADLFISVHVNANPNRLARGTETFAMGIHKNQSNLEVAKQENAAILYEEDHDEQYEGFDPQSAESYIIFSLMQDAYLKQSLNFASSIQDNFEAETGLNNRGVKQAGFLVLYKTTMPRVLVEAGFISNPEEENYLNSDKGKEKIAASIFKAFKQYKENAEENNVKLAEYPNTKKKNDSISYKLQIAASVNKISTDADFFKNHENVEVHKDEDNYKYTVGNYDNYEEAVKYKEEIQEDFPGAFVVAYKNNQIISVKKALSQKEN